MNEFSSFRDPSGYVFKERDICYRHINASYQQPYEKMMKSGLYTALVKEKLLVSHTEIEDQAQEDQVWHKRILPQQIPFISYPYEWCFGQYKDAALATLKIQRKALDFGMVLKDASAYNIQFLNNRPVLIDTLSFDNYIDGVPWVAYGQFCRHFLAPLLLMSYVDIRLSQLMRVYIDGIPLDLAGKLLGRKGGLTALQHIHWHANSVKKHENDGAEAKQIRKVILSKGKMVAIVDSLIRAIEGMNSKTAMTEWGDYYDRTNYNQSAADSKAEIISDFLSRFPYKMVWDFGANDGRYSRLASNGDSAVVAFDIDPIAVNINYNTEKKLVDSSMLPLILDLTNPSPGIGFACKERTSINDRGKPDCILALAVIHHLSISNNLPLGKVAEWFSSLAPYLIIEFVPKDDSQVKLLLSSREDIFPNYTKEGMEVAFKKYYDLIDGKTVRDSKRFIYLFKRKS